MRMRPRILMFMALFVLTAVGVTVLALGAHGHARVLRQVGWDAEIVGPILGTLLPVDTDGQAPDIPKDVTLGGRLVDEGVLKVFCVTPRDPFGVRCRGPAGASSAPWRQGLTSVMAAPTGGIIATRESGIDMYNVIRDANGRVVGAFFARFAREGLDASLAREWVTVGGLGLLIVAVGLAVALHMVDQFVRPLDALTRAASALQAGHPPPPDLLAHACAREDELGRLARVFSVMASRVGRRMRALDDLVARRTAELSERNRALTRAQSLIEDELSAARELQLAILPKAMPTMPGWRGAARMRAAQHMAGDFYDFIVLPGGHLGLVMADVAGKGVSAAFMMAVARTLLREAAMRARDPGAVLARTNVDLCAQGFMDNFVTVFYGRLDPVSGVLSYALGGHMPPMVRRADGRVHCLDRTGGIALGIAADARFPTRTATLEPGDMLLTWTDGVTEAFDNARTPYGAERLAHILAQARRADADALVETVLADVARFAGAAPQSDDITVAALARTTRTRP